MEYALIFDLGGVLLRFDHRTTCEALARHSELGTEEAYAAIFESGLEEQYDKGLVTSTRFFEGLQQQCRLEGLAYDDFARAWSDIFTEMPGMDGLLTDLRGSPAVETLVLLSNTNELHYGHLCARFGHLLAHFDSQLLSFEMHVRKPEPEAFRQALSASGLPPERCVFIDDTEANVAAARDIGMRSLHFTTREALIGDLGRLGVLTAEGRRSPTDSP